ncbi:MAG TPA: hypothetical protein PK011_15865 [Marinagarivorans sp.]|nr:hypothetical protein [Cellvibrionaceae bacterium]HMY40801.1 hypothetical protein [Marinagarivorans sp.]
MHFLADDSAVPLGKHYVTLLDGAHFIFVTAYQCAGQMPPMEDAWEGGSQLELPVLALKPLTTQMAWHFYTVSHRTLRSQAVFRHEELFAGETLSLGRDYVTPGYTIRNHARKVHLPWASEEWVQEFRLADNLLFEQGYHAALTQLANDYA